MTRFILRRLLQMIPTLLGVVMITFVLFNLVGGSPAAMTLGERASPKSLEEFDEQRGINKPLFFGWSAPTRALPAWDLASPASPWLKLADPTPSEESEVLRLPAGRTDLPFAFRPLPGTYRIAIGYTAASEGFVLRGTGIVARLPAASGGRIEVDVEAPFEAITLEAGEGGVTLLGVSMTRRMASPWDSQLLFFLRQLLRLDFGVSAATNQPVVGMLRDGIVPTLMLTAPILVLETLLSLGLAMLCAFYRGRWPDRAVLVVCVALMSVNYIVWIVAGQYVLAYKLGWFPVWGFESWAYLALPILVGTLSGLGSNVRLYRTVVLDELYKDYVRTAHSKGLGPVSVLVRHVLPNAMIPVITNVALSIPYLYTGSLLLESFFGIPGLGYLSVNAINAADVDVVRAVVLVGSALYLASNLLADLCYAWVDPRVRLQ